MVRICHACRFGAHCIFEATARGRLLQCEQFELALPPATLRTTAGITPGSRLAGLCSNCEFHEACIYPKPEGGVWRCEEYR